MRMFIRIRNGRPFGNPISEDNFINSFPDINLDDLPEGFEECFRSDKPNLGPYEIEEATYYDWDINVVKEKFKIRPMTEQEKLEKQEFTKTLWKENSGFVSWVFNEETCSFVAPVPYPSDNAAYVWNEDALSWDWVGPAIIQE